MPVPERAARAVGVDLCTRVAVSGWEAMPSRWWPMVAAALPKPWPEEAVKFHLRWWAARERLSDGARPRRPSFVELTGWTDYAMRQIMANVEGWEDPRFVKSSTDARQVVDKRSTDARQVENESTPVIAEDSTGVRQVFDESSTDVQPAIILTRVGSQSTEHRAQSTEKKPAPASAVADLFTPDSQPDAATGEATGDTAPPPGCADPLPAEEDDAPTPGKPREPITPAIAQAIGVLSKLNPKAAERMTLGKSDTLVKATRKAIKALGLPALLARLEYAATVQDDEPMKFWRTTLGGKLAPLLTVDGPWVRGLDEAAAETAERIKDSGGVDLEAEAASAWFDMTQRRGWKTICYPGGAPNRPGDFGQPERWDLSDTADEHDRRMTAFLRAGSIPKWQMADAQGRIEFRARWIGFYVDEVKA